MQEFLTKGSLGEVQTGQVISFGAGLLVAQHQLTSVAAAKTLVLRLLPPFAFPLFVLSLPSLGFGLGRVAVGVLQEEKGRWWTPERHPNIQVLLSAHLWPVTQETAAVRSAAATRRFLIAETVQVIVERQLGSFHTTEGRR